MNMHKGQITRVSAPIVKALTLLLIFASCTNDIVFFNYSSTSPDGWEKNDTVTFNVPPVRERGHYSAMLGLRVNNSYPFQSITLIVEQTIYSKSRSIRLTRDTVTCHITTEDGTITGQGLYIYQYDQPLHLAPALAAGDSLHYAIRHNMRRNILPGVSDVGIRLRREY